MCSVSSFIERFYILPTLADFLLLVDDCAVPRMQSNSLSEFSIKKS